ncbi:MAG: ribosome biogenesis GTPase YlqF [Cellvibrionales bacterium]|nr:ribosome biogenesis GTPase YlqF [Cellvibrionales bacterium]
MAINWFPGHMHKATKSLRNILPKIDVIVEILDARIPYSSENPVIQTFAQDKFRIKLLNKADLADTDKIQDWLNYYNQQPNVSAKSLSMLQKEKVQGLIDDLLQYKLSIDKVGPLNVLCVGIPNVGKSTLINHWLGRKALKTGNEPAVTKDIQKIKLGDDIMLWDSPGILWPKVENPKSGYRLAVTGAIKDTAIDHSDVAYFAAEFFLENYFKDMQTRFDWLESLLDPVLFLEAFAQHAGALGKKGAIDFDRVSKLFLTDVRSGQIAIFTMETPEMMVEETKETQALIEAKEKAKVARKKKH